MRSVKIPLTVALWAVPRFRQLNKENDVKITCFYPTKVADTEFDDLLDNITKGHPPIVEVVVEEDFFDSFVLFLKQHFDNEEAKISETNHTTRDELFVESLD